MRALPFAGRADAPVAADLIDAPVNFQAVIVRIAKLYGDLTTSPAAAGEINFDPVPAQMVVGSHDFVKGRNLKGDVVEVGIRGRFLPRPHERDPVMIGI